jgi:tRNA A-37 threonylcarbamoyl transferase component Bud32
MRRNVYYVINHLIKVYTYGSITRHLAVNILDLITDCKDLYTEWVVVGPACLQLAAMITEKDLPSIESLIKQTKNCPHILEKNIPATDIHGELIKSIQLSILHHINFQVDQETIAEYIKLLIPDIDPDKKTLIDFVVEHIVCSKYHMCFKPDILARNIINFVDLYVDESFANILVAISTDPTYTLIMHTLQKAHVLGFMNSAKLFYDLLEFKSNYQITCDWKNLTNFSEREIHIRKIAIVDKKSFLAKSDGTPKKIGKGTYGTVFKTKMSNDEICAYKIHKIDPKEDSVIDPYCLREINALLKFDHPNIISLKYIVVAPNEISFAMEYMSKTLTKYIFDTIMKPIAKYNLAIQFMEGLAEIHDAGYVHRDLSTSNILVDNTNKIVLKICDFGLARNLRSNTLDATQITGYVCALFYRAPEILLADAFPKKSEGPEEDHPLYNDKIDIWSAACIIYYIFTKNHLFDCDLSQDMSKYIYGIVGKSTTGSNFETLNNFDPNLKFNPSKLALLFDPYPLLGSILKPMLSYDPNLRPSAVDILTKLKIARSKLFT